MSPADADEQKMEQMVEEMKETETEYHFGPFDPPRYCNKEYPGIETECGAEATHILEMTYRMQTMEMVRCDEHGFPWVVRARREQALGHPLCEVCHHRDPVARIQPNDPVGTYEAETEEGEEVDAYICEECEEYFDVDVDPL